MSHVCWCGANRMILSGDYYRLMPEGRVEDYDGILIKPQTIKEGLDLNRNFPAAWRQEQPAKGRGALPRFRAGSARALSISSPATTTSTARSASTPSVVCSCARLATSPTATCPARILWVYQKIGQKGTDITGYPNISIFHDFKYHPQQVISGGFDWTYMHLGMFMWAVEIWSPQRQAGIDRLQVHRLVSRTPDRP